jgi:hypothetical protein
VIAARKGGKAKTATYVVTGLFSLLLEIAQYVPALSALDARLFTTLHLANTVLYGACFLLAYISFVDYLVLFGKISKKG